MVSQAMQAFFKDEIFNSEFAIAFSISLPFLIQEERESKVAALIYKSDIYNENSIECIGFLHYDGAVKYTMRLINPQNESAIFSLIKKADLTISSKEDHVKIIEQIYAKLNEITFFALNAPDTLTQQQRATVSQYVQLLRTVVPESLLNCYYAVSPDFFDWCCVIALNS